MRVRQGGVEPVAYHGSSHLNALAGADGLIRVEQGVWDIAEGSRSMFDRFDRPITYLRISVTDKCNLRCRYCMPAEGVPPRRHEDILTLEQLADAARAAVGLGVTKIRLTGGEPLVRRGIVDLVRMIASIEGLEHLAHDDQRDAPRARRAALRDAGLDSLNVSLDTLDPDRYREITRGGSDRGGARRNRRGAGRGLPVQDQHGRAGRRVAPEIQPMREFCDSIGRAAPAHQPLRAVTGQEAMDTRSTVHRPAQAATASGSWRTAP